MDRREFLAAAGAAALSGRLLADRPPGFAAAETALSDFADLATKIAQQALPILTQKLAGQGRVAVFAPGDAEGKATVAISESARILQGELIYNLINLARGRFIVLDKAGLAQTFARRKVDLTQLDRTDPAATAGVLAQLNLDAAVLGSIDASNPAGGAPATTVKTALALQFRDGQMRQLTGQVTPDAVVTSRSIRHKRLAVELWLTPPGGPPQRVPVFADGRGDQYATMMYAALPRGLALGTPAAQYKVRLRNTGEGGVLSRGRTNRDLSKERARLFSAALAVDGVNTVYQDRGDGRVGPVMVHPRNARKWIMAGPGQMVVKYGPQPTDWRLDPDPRGGPGHSVIDVPGFQQDGQTSLTFTFAPAGESVAEAVGVTSEIGVITAYFFAQELSGEEDSIIAGNAPVDGAPIGTAAGPARRHLVSRIKIDTYPDPVAEYRIFYRPEDQVPIPPEHRIDPWAKT